MIGYSQDGQGNIVCQVYDAMVTNDDYIQALREDIHTLKIIGNDTEPMQWDYSHLNPENVVIKRFSGVLETAKLPKATVLNIDTQYSEDVDGVYLVVDTPLTADGYSDLCQVYLNDVYLTSLNSLLAPCLQVNVTRLDATYVSGLVYVDLDKFTNLVNIRLSDNEDLGDIHGTSLKIWGEIENNYEQDTVYVDSDSEEIVIFKLGVIWAFGEIFTADTYPSDYPKYDEVVAIATEKQNK